MEKEDYIKMSVGSCSFLVYSFINYLNSSTSTCIILKKNAILKNCF